MSIGASAAVVALATVAVGRLTRASTARQLREPARRSLRPAALWRMVPVWLGILGIALVVLLRRARPHSNALTLDRVFIVAAAGAILGLAIGLRPLTEVLAQAAGRRARSVSVRLAARRLEAEASSSCRILLAAVAVVMIAAVSAAVLESADQANGVGDSRQIAQVPSDEVQPASATTLSELPARAFAAEVSTPPTVTGGAALSTDPGTADIQVGVSITYASCASLRDFDRLAGSCRDGTSYRVVEAGTGGFANDLPAGRVIGAPGRTLRIPAAELPVSSLDDDALLSPDSIVVTSPPPSPLPGGGLYEFRLGGRGRDIERFQNALSALSVTATATFQMGDLDSLRRFQINAGVIRAATITGFVLCLLAFLIAAADRSRERRRSVAVLVAIGAPRRTIRASQILELVIPAAVALVGALVVGVLVGNTYLSLGESMPHGFFFGTITAALPLAAFAALVVVLSGAVLGGRRVAPSLLRRE